MKNILSESTLVPVSLIAVFAGGVVWMTTIYNTGVSNAQTIQEVVVRQEKYFEIIIDIRERLKRIETILEKQEK